MVLKILLFFFGAILLILIIPVHVSTDYNEQFMIHFRWLVFSYKYPRTLKKTESTKKKIQKNKKVEKKSAKGGILKGKGISGFIRLMKEITGISGRAVCYVIKHSHISLFKIEVIVGGEDAAHTAIDCGLYAALVYPAVSALSVLNSTLKPQIRISPDYDRDSTTASFKARGLVWPIIVIRAAAVALFKYIKGHL